VATVQGSSNYVVSRERLLLFLAAPFALLLGASLISWPWRSLSLPGAVGSLTPPGILLLVLVVVAAMYALQRRLPMGLITWLPAGQGALVLLTTGFAARSSDAFVGIGVIAAYVIIYLIVLAFALIIAGSSVPLAMSFVAFFVLTQAARFPVFSVDAETPTAASEVLTLLAFLIAAAELGFLAWLARRLIEAPEGQGGGVALIIVALAVFHGLLAAWEDPALRGDLSFVAIVEQFVRWLFLVGIQMGMAFALIRLRRSWSVEPRWAEPAPEDMPARVGETQATISDWPSARKGGRPTPRRRRRR
jgi:hypothetical protein